MALPISESWKPPLMPPPTRQPSDIAPTKSSPSGVTAMSRSNSDKDPVAVLVSSVVTVRAY